MIAHLDDGGAPAGKDPRQVDGELEQIGAAPAHDIAAGRDVVLERGVAEAKQRAAR